MSAKLLDLSFMLNSFARGSLCHIIDLKRTVSIGSLSSINY